MQATPEQLQPEAPKPAPGHTRGAWVAGLLLSAAALAAVLLLYRDPAFLVMLSDMIWACFG